MIKNILEPYSLIKNGIFYEFHSEYLLKKSSKLSIEFDLIINNYWIYLNSAKNLLVKQKDGYISQLLENGHLI